MLQTLLELEQLRWLQTHLRLELLRLLQILQGLEQWKWPVQMMEEEPMWLQLQTLPKWGPLLLLMPQFRSHQKPEPELKRLLPLLQNPQKLEVVL